mgnify:FL=1
MIVLAQHAMPQVLPDAQVVLLLESSSTNNAYVPITIISADPLPILLECDSSCATCNNIGSTGCTSCFSSRVMYNKKCVCIRIIFLFIDFLTLIVCDGSCGICYGSGAQFCATCLNSGKYVAASFICEGNNC